MMHLLANVRLLGSIQLESGHAYCLTGLDRDVDRGLQSLLPWQKECAGHRVIVFYTSFANLIPCPAIFGQRLAKAIVFASRCIR